jgi:hypothetical protein
VCFVIYKSYLASLWNAGWTFGRSVQIAVLIWLLLGACWVMWVRRTRPDVMRPDAEAFIAPEATGR